MHLVYAVTVKENNEPRAAILSLSGDISTLSSYRHARHVPPTQENQ